DGHLGSFFYCPVSGCPSSIRLSRPAAGELGGRARSSAAQEGSCGEHQRHSRSPSQDQRKGLFLLRQSSSLARRLTRCLAIPCLALAASDLLPWGQLHHLLALQGLQKLPSRLEPALRLHRQAL